LIRADGPYWCRWRERRPHVMWLPGALGRGQAAGTDPPMRLEGPPRFRAGGRSSNVGSKRSLSGVV